MLIVWGKNDKIFPPVGANACLRDLPKVELHLFGTGHFTLDEEEGDQIGSVTLDFLHRQIKALQSER